MGKNARCAQAELIASAAAWARSISNDLGGNDGYFSSGELAEGPWRCRARGAVRKHLAMSKTAENALCTQKKKQVASALTQKKEIFTHRFSGHVQKHAIYGHFVPIVVEAMNMAELCSNALRGSASEDGPMTLQFVAISDDPNRVAAALSSRFVQRIEVAPSSRSLRARYVLGFLGRHPTRKGAAVTPPP